MVEMNSTSARLQALQIKCNAGAAPGSRNTQPPGPIATMSSLNRSMSGRIVPLVDAQSSTLMGAQNKTKRGVAITPPVSESKAYAEPEGLSSRFAVWNAAAIGFFVGVCFTLAFQAYTKPAQVEYRIVTKVRA